MRLVFAGTPEFAERALAALLGAGHEVALVLTQPDRPAGRGLRPVPSAVKRLAVSRGLEVYQPAALDDAACDRIASTNADLLVVAAYGLILPPAGLASTRLGAFNIHASLLPRWRGAAPIQRALLAGDAETGITIMRMDAGLDTGPVLAQARVPIEADEDAGSLHDKLAALGASMIVDALAEAAAGRLRAEPQPREGVTYARKLERSDAEIDWRRPAVEIERVVRAMRPSPGAVTRLRGTALKIWRGGVREARGAAGAVLAADDAGVLVGCADRAFLISELQRAGGRRLSASEFLRGCAIAPGEHLG